MADVFTRKKRSNVMSQIRGKGNKSTEIKLLNLFRVHGVTGWRRHQPITGKPDFVFRKERLTVFVDGCFWHGCPTCYIKPKQNAEFWENKIGGNIRRDRKVGRQLRADGWSVCRVWECKLKKPDVVMRRIQRMLGRD
jgi:DNA mismatch endonuclease, patch repair protein